jgi:hypothetical protein
MTRGATYVALCAGTIAFALAFTYPMYTPTRVLWYLPLERDWVLAVKPKQLGMDFYGRVLLAMIAWAVAFVPTWLVARRLKPPSPRTIGLFTAWAVTATVLACLHYGWILYFRNPVPEPLPSWYQPR